MAFLLDTNILSDLVRNPRGRIARRIAEVGEQNVCTSIIVAAELRYGAAKAGSARLEAQLAAVLDTIEGLPFEPPADVAYGALRAELEQQGRPIGANDMLIAAQAVALGHTLVTDNTREFSQISRLTVMNWLR